VEVHVEPVFEENQSGPITVTLVESFASGYKIAANADQWIVRPGGDKARPDGLGFFLKAPGFPPVRLNAVCGPYEKRGGNDVAEVTLRPSFKAGIAPAIVQTLPMSENGIPVIRVVVQNPTDIALPITQAQIDATSGGGNCFTGKFPVPTYDVRLSTEASMITATGHEIGDRATAPRQKVQIMEHCGLYFDMSVALPWATQLAPRGPSTLQLRILIDEKARKKREMLEGWEDSWLWSFTLAVRMPDGGSLLLPTGQVCLSEKCRKVYPEADRR
jgi:hypothetical protein